MYQVILLFISLFKSSHFYIIRLNRFQVHKLCTKNVLKYKNDKLSIVKNNTAKRESCPKCKRAKSVCICFTLPENLYKSRVNLLVLQHPNEIKKGIIASVPIVPMFLSNCHIIRGITFDSTGYVDWSTGSIRDQLHSNDSWWLTPVFNQRLFEIFQDKCNPPLLLYPGENSIDIEEHYNHHVNNLLTNSSQIHTTTIDDHHAAPTINLIVIDGTWAEAKKIIKRSPTIIQNSKLVKFSSSIESVINPIRSGNTESMMSTLESISQAIKILDPRPEAVAVADNMIKALDAVVTHQITAWRKYSRPNEYNRHNRLN